MTLESPELAMSYLKVSQDQLHVVLSKLKEIANDVSANAKEGKVLRYLSEEAEKASQNLQVASEEFKKRKAENGSVVYMPLQNAMTALSMATHSISLITDKVDSLDEKSGFSAKVKSTIHDVVTQARATLKFAEDKFNRIQSSIAELRNRSAETSQRALQQLIELKTRVVESGVSHPSLETPLELLNQAIHEVTESINKVKTAPFTEVPVAALHESLALGRKAVESALPYLEKLPVISSIVEGGESEEQGGKAKSMALPNIATLAKSQLDNALALTNDLLKQTKDTGNAKIEDAKISASKAFQTIIERSMELAVSADVCFGISTKAASIDAEYKLFDKAKGASVAMLDVAQKVDKNYDIVNKASSFDNKYLKGLGTAIVLFLLGPVMKYFFDLIKQYKTLHSTRSKSATSFTTSSNNPDPATA